MNQFAQSSFYSFPNSDNEKKLECSKMSVDNPRGPASRGEGAVIRHTIRQRKT